MNSIPRTKIYFASDAHLGSRYLEAPLVTEKKLVAWLDSIKYDAKELWLLGDMFDYWYEYKYVVPKGHVRFLGKLAELSDVGVEIHMFTGNHDIWMFDYLPQEMGMRWITGAGVSRLSRKYSGTGFAKCCIRQFIRAGLSVLR